MGACELGSCKRRQRRQTHQPRAAPWIIGVLQAPQPCKGATGRDGPDSKRLRMDPCVTLFGVCAKT